MVWVGCGRTVGRFPAMRQSCKQAAVAAIKRQPTRYGPKISHTRGAHPHPHQSCSCSRSSCCCAGGCSAPRRQTCAPRSCGRQVGERGDVGSSSHKAGEQALGASSGSQVGRGQMVTRQYCSHAQMQAVESQRAGCTINPASAPAHVHAVLEDELVLLERDAAAKPAGQGRMGNPRHVNNPARKRETLTRCGALSQPPTSQLQPGAAAVNCHGLPK